MLSIDAAYCYLSVACSVCQSLGLTVTQMYPAKTAEPIEMLCGMWARMGISNHVLDVGVWIPSGRDNFCGGEGAIP